MKKDEHHMTRFTFYLTEMVTLPITLSDYSHPLIFPFWVGGHIVGKSEARFFKFRNRYYAVQLLVPNRGQHFSAAPHSVAIRTSALIHRAVQRNSQPLHSSELWPVVTHEMERRAANELNDYLR